MHVCFVLKLMLSYVELVDLKKRGLCCESVVVAKGSWVGAVFGLAGMLTLSRPIA